MRPSFYPRLINDPFSDPGLYIPFLFENRAMMFDLGDNSPLSARDILKIGHVFVTHTHMDHFVGFDRLLRLFLGRDKTLHLYGPKGFLQNVRGKLAGYEWNLVGHFSNNFICRATEVHPEYTLTLDYECRDRFRPRRNACEAPFSGLLHDEPGLRVSAVILDHRIPCLGLTIEERFHINIKKDRVLEMGLEIGPWLKTFKAALFGNAAPDSPFEVPSAKNPSKGKKFALGELADHIARITPGQKVTYIADVVYSESNAEKIAALAKDADQLFIEAAFLDQDRHIAEEKYHLTAGQAGRIARMAGAKQFNLFHFSPRYNGRSAEFHREAMQAYESAE